MSHITEKHELRIKQIGLFFTGNWKKVLIFLAPVVIYLPGILGRIPFVSESAVYTDLLLTHYPNAVFLRRSILEFQQIPLWSQLIYSGAPFAANPLSGLFYLPGWISLLFPLPAGLSFTLAIHAVLGSWGMYYFLKQENVSEIGAITGGLIFGLTPKLAAHYGAGHVSLIYAICWTPWLFKVSRNDQAGWKTGIIAALIFLADPRWVVYSGIFWFLFDIAYRHKRGVFSSFTYYLKSGITAFLLSAPLIFPLFEYIKLSTRSRMGFGDILAFSLPPENLLGLFVPVQGVNPEWYLYAGGSVLALFLIQLFIPSIRKVNRFWNIWILLALLISSGCWFINPDWLEGFPVISLLRVPSRIIFLMGFSFAVIAANTLDYLLKVDFQQVRIPKISFGLILFGTSMTAAISIILGEFPHIAIWGFSFLVITAGYLALIKKDLFPRKWGWILIGILVVDLLGAGVNSYFVKNKKVDPSTEILETISEDQGIYRIYSPSYSIPQYTAVGLGYEMADGVDPMQIAAYSDFMLEASGVNQEGYFVTIPPFVSGVPAVDNKEAALNPFLLSLLDVKYIISDYEIYNRDLEDITGNGPGFLYLNKYETARAWVENKPRSVGNFLVPGIENVEEMNSTPNRINIKASGPGMLVLSEINYPGWKVFVDGNQEEIKTTYGLLRSIDLAEGSHKIEFSFQPLTVYAGLGLAVVGWVLVSIQINRNKK